MIKIFNPIKLDVARHNDLSVVLAKQGDKNSRFLIVTVCLNGSIICIPKGASVKLNVIRSDSIGASFDGWVLDDGRVTVPVDRWITSVVGDSRCSVEISGGDEILSTMRFTVRTEESDDVNDIGDPEISPTDPEYDAVLEMIEDYKNGELGSSEIFIRYSDTADGEEFSESCEESNRYFGIASGKNAPTVKSGYKWIPIADVNGKSIKDLYLVGEMEGYKEYRIVFTDGTMFEYTVEDGVDGVDGADGNGVSSFKVEYVGEDEEGRVVNEYVMRFTDGSKVHVPVTDGKDGGVGADGRGIVRIVSEAGGTDENGRPFIDYRIDYTDGTRDNIVVTDGKDGTSPHIGENGNWFVGGVDTGVSARPDFEEYTTPTLYFYGDISAMTKENAVTLNYTYGERSGTCTLKWQGSSSIAYPKKNYTVKFDNAFEAVSGWGEENKYCLKADWVDFSHCRNVVSAKLWGDIVRSREASDLVTRLSALPNGGAIDGFPCFVVINGEWQGIFNFNIPKDGWMMGMGSGTNEAILCAEGAGTPGEIFAGEAVLGTDFSLEYASEGWAESDIQASLNTLINAVVNSDGTDIDTTIAQYLDIDSAIDYMLYTQLLGHHDGIKKNYILATYDGVKWFFSAYDMDNVFGQLYPGDNFHSASLGLLWLNENKLFELLYNHKLDALRDRLEILRNQKHSVTGTGYFYDGVMSVANVAQKFTNHSSKIPLAAYIADAEKWQQRPSTAINNVEQAIAWYAQRLEVLVKHYEEVAVIYSGTRGLRYSTEYSTMQGIGSCTDTDIVLPADPSVYAMAYYAFQNNTFIESVIIPENYTHIYDSAFNGCTSLKKISLPKTVTKLGWGCFSGCTSLRGVSLPAVMSIDNNTFANCTGLVRVHLGKLPKIPNNFFNGCSALRDVYYDGTTAEWNALSKGSAWSLTGNTFTVHCSDGDITVTP